MIDTPNQWGGSDRRIGGWIVRDTDDDGVVTISVLTANEVLYWKATFQDAPDAVLVNTIQEAYDWIEQRKAMAK